LQVNKQEKETALLELFNYHKTP